MFVCNVTISEQNDKMRANIARKSFYVSVATFFMNSQ
jgi:hypothetical protein